MQKLCRVCSVPLEGARELDEGHGTICLVCMIYEARDSKYSPLLIRLEALIARVERLENK